MTMSCAQSAFELRTPGRGLHDVTAQVRAAVRASGVATGLAHVFVETVPVGGREPVAQPAHPRTQGVQKAQRSAREPAEQSDHFFYNRAVAELLNYLRGDSQIPLKRSPLLQNCKAGNAFAT